MKRYFKELDERAGVKPDKNPENPPKDELKPDVNKPDSDKPGVKNKPTAAYIKEKVDRAVEYKKKGDTAALKRIQDEAKNLGYEEELNAALKEVGEKSDDKIKKPDKKYIDGKIAKALQDADGISEGKPGAGADLKKIQADAKAKGYESELDAALKARHDKKLKEKEQVLKDKDKFLKDKSGAGRLKYSQTTLDQKDASAKFDAQLAEAQETLAQTKKEGGKNPALKQTIPKLSNAAKLQSDQKEIQESQDEYMNLQSKLKNASAEDQVKIKAAMKETHNEATEARRDKINIKNKIIQEQKTIWAEANAALNTIPKDSKKLLDINARKDLQGKKDAASAYATSLRAEINELRNADPNAKPPLPVALLNTGGYTGDFVGGKIGILHEKELVLNKQDTKNILDSVKISREMASSFATNAKQVFSSVSNQDSSANTTIINASFPNVSSSEEIRKAFANMSNNASQFAYKMRSAY
jgi:hypothetical protein